MTDQLGLGVAMGARQVLNEDDTDDLRLAVAALALIETLQINDGADRGTVTQRRQRSSASSRQRCNLILRGPDVIFKDIFRMPKVVFYHLLNWLKLNGRVKDTRSIPLELMLLVFLWILAFDEPQRNAAWRFRLSQSSISNIFHKLIDAMRLLHSAFVRQPDHDYYVSTLVVLNHKRRAFEGAVGAIDGTHIPAHVPHKKQQRFFSRNNNISQNVLAAVSFDGLFTYVLAGSEGSINDSVLLREALSRSFRVPSGRYFLGDAGFALQRGVLTPYTGVRYHLQDWEDSDLRPINERELFNHRHFSLRTTVERAFGQWKRK